MLALLASVLAQDPKLPELDPSPRPYIALMFTGFLVGALGHLLKVKAMILAGILMIFAATILIPLLVQLRS
jgi:hypothetical protein